MKMSGETIIPCSRAQVWAALNDSDVLRRCIPGCELLEPVGENGFTAVAVVKIGPVKARFKGSVTLSDLDPPHSYRISGQGEGGVAGFARGGAEVVLVELDPGSTALRYNVNAEIGGKLAQLGQRLIDGAASKIAAEFFARFTEVVQERVEVVTS